MSTGRSDDKREVLRFLRTNGLVLQRGGDDGGPCLSRLPKSKWTRCAFEISVGNTFETLPPA